MVVREAPVAGLAVGVTRPEDRLAEGAHQVAVSKANDVWEGAVVLGVLVYDDVLHLRSFLLVASPNLTCMRLVDYSCDRVGADSLRTVRRIR